MMGSVPNTHRVKVRLQGFAGNSLWANLGWFRIHGHPKIVIDQVVAGVYFVANG
jgi:hypothetical protein